MLCKMALRPHQCVHKYAQQINWLIASFNFPFDNSSEYHACKTFHSACKTSDRFSIAAVSANTLYVFAHWHVCMPWQAVGEGDV